MQDSEAKSIRDGATFGGPTAPVDYPESDGLPMAETPWHMQAMFDAIGSLKEYFRDRSEVYVGGNTMMYYAEGDPRSCVSPDVFVALGVAKLPERRVWRTWTEGKLADFVLEVTSVRTRRVDEVTKRGLYAKLAVREYWRFDPDGDYLDPMLKGHRLGLDGTYRPLALEERDGALCHGSVLGLDLRLEGRRLRFFDPVRKEYLPTMEEERVARGAAEAARDRGPGRGPGRGNVQ